MNDAHWHLLVNHIPIIGGLLATLILGFGLLRRSAPIIQLALGLLVCMSLGTVLTNLTGDEAEHYLRSIRALDEARFHQHEDASTLASIAMYLTGVAALLDLVWARARRLPWLPAVVFALALLTSGLMANVGRLGGLIMHKELQSGQPVPVSPRPSH
ncbi:PWWP domain-containing protein [Spirosoma luteolum]